MSRPPLQAAPGPSSLYQRLLALFGRNERHVLNAADSEATSRFLERLRTRKDCVCSAYTFADRQPPRGARFDAWGKTWNARTDEFEWERFPNCYMEPKSATTIGADLEVNGLPDYAKHYKILWWTTIMVPPVVVDRVELD